MIANCLKPIYQLIHFFLHWPNATFTIYISIATIFIISPISKFLKLK